MNNEMEKARAIAASAIGSVEQALADLECAAWDNEPDDAVWTALRLATDHANELRELMVSISHKGSR